MKKLVTLLMLAVVSASVSAADVSGTWSLDAINDDGSGLLTATITFKQEGQKLTGSCRIRDSGEMMDATGHVDGNKIVWRCENRAERHDSELTGTVREDGASMKGTWSSGGGGTGTFTATREQ